MMSSARQTDIPPVKSSIPAPGHLVVVSGPSGVGKGTLVNALLQRTDLDASRSVSCTTRPPRPGEKHGVDYFFISPEAFERRVEQQEFLEHALYGSHRYGTPRQPVEDMLARGRDVILVIEVQGARQIRSLRPDAVFVFICPPTPEELVQRLTGRHTETPEAVQERLRIARQEMEHLWHYDYQVINDRVEAAEDRLRAILIAERCRIRNRDRQGEQTTS